MDNILLFLYKVTLNLVEISESQKEFQETKLELKEELS